MVKVGPQVGSSSIAQAAFQLWGQLEDCVLASSHTKQCQLYYTLEKTINSRGFRVECLQPSMDVSDALCISSTCINSPVV